jgi:hypothetical protein
MSSPHSDGSASPCGTTLNGIQVRKLYMSSGSDFYPILLITKIHDITGCHTNKIAVADADERSKRLEQEVEQKYKKLARKEEEVNKCRTEILYRWR